MSPRRRSLIAPSLCECAQTGWWFDDSSEQYYITHSRALRANRREAEADEYLQKAYERVMLVANKTEGETFRRSWMENVSDNREILAEWEMRLKEHEGKCSQYCKW